MKRACLICGLLLLAGLWLGPLPEWTAHSFAAHMTLHMGVVSIASPLLAVGIAGGCCDFVQRWPAAFPAIPWSIVELAVVWSWHAPVLHHAARGAPGSFVAEQFSFFAAGLAVWLASISGPRAVFTISAPFFILAKAAAFIMPRVAGVSGACTEI